MYFNFYYVFIIFIFCFLYFYFMNKSFKIFNRPKSKTFRKHLRNNATTAEATLWKFLQQRQLEGRKFRRQHGIGKYIVDFYCPTEKLVIELDGEGHYSDAGLAYDLKRTRYFEELGIRVVRFENNEVFKNLEYVLEKISENF